MTNKLYEQKEELVQWLMLLEDPVVIEKVLRLKEENEADWGDHLSEQEQRSIKNGIEDAELNQVTSHSIVKRRYEKWL